MKANVSLKGIQRAMRHLLLVVSIIGLLVTSATYGYWAGGILLRDTHCVITTRAINDLSRSEYPDIWKFATPIECTEFGPSHPGGPIIKAASDENAHFEMPNGGGKQYWFRNDLQWATRLVDEYTRFNFENTYFFLGHATHLAEDETVPAHAKVVFHGPNTRYWYDTEVASPLDIEHSGLPLSDDLEAYTAITREEARNCPDDNPFCWDHVYEHQMSPLAVGCETDPCDWTFWLSAAGERRGYERGWVEGEGPGKNWGGWGRGCEQGGVRCTNPFHDGDPCFGRLGLCSPLGDWHSRVDPCYPEVARGQLFYAHQQARNRLTLISQALPPLFKNYGLSASDFTAAQGTTLSFLVSENRTQSVFIAILAVELDATSVPIAGTERAIVTREGTWDGRTVALAATPEGDRSRLPWESSFSTTWNGQVAGAPLVTGRPYALWLKIVDGDGNESFDTPNPAAGGLWSSLRRFQLR